MKKAILFITLAIVSAKIASAQLSHLQHGILAHI